MHSPQLISNMLASCSLFQNKLVEDDRTPIFTLMVAGHQFGFYSLEIIFWVQVFAVVLLVGLFACSMWAITYYCIIPRRGQITCYLIGFGIVCPLMAWFPFWLLHALDIQNKIIRFCSSAIYPIVTMFHTIEAMFGFSPVGVEDSFWQYVLYNASVLDIQYEIDPKTEKKRPIRTTMQDKLEIIGNFGKYLALIGVYISLLSTRVEPYRTDANGNVPGFDLAHLMDFNLFRNNVVATILFQMTLTTFTIALSGMVGFLLGVKTSEAMKNPVFESTSPSDFWGRRWNLIIHGSLKRGVFKPVYKYSSNKAWAVLATFLASGAFHEYLLLVVFWQGEQKGIDIAFGKNTAFMLWNAGIVTMEHFLGKNVIFQWIKRTFPRPVVTFMILCTALPIAHWFIHPYSKTGVFDDLSVGFPMVKVIK